MGRAAAPLDTTATSAAATTMIAMPTTLRRAAAVARHPIAASAYSAISFLCVWRRGDVSDVALGVSDTAGVRRWRSGGRFGRDSVQHAVALYERSGIAAWV
jgi:hypothetical protein